METLIFIIISTVLVTLISLSGAAFLYLREDLLRKVTVPLVAFSAGSFIGGAFLHLIPEAIEEMGELRVVMMWVIVGFIIFLLFEQFIHWHHCHRMPSEHKHPVTYMILFSDGVHNFIDGLTIGIAFLVDPGLGLVTTLAVAAHEIPQELGDFGVLVHGGWSKTKALYFNLLSGIPMVLGGLLVWVLGREIDVTFLLPIAAGNFIYIAAADLIPEFRSCEHRSKNLLHLGSFLFGLALMYGLLFLEF